MKRKMKNKFMKMNNLETFRNRLEPNKNEQNQKASRIMRN